MYREMGPATTMTDSAIEACLCPTLVCVPVCTTPARDGPLAAGAGKVPPRPVPASLPATLLLFLAAHLLSAASHFPVLV